MEDDDFVAPDPGSLHELENDSLDALSIDELEHRISRLEAEIARTRAAIGNKRRDRDIAESFFGR